MPHYLIYENAVYAYKAESEDAALKKHLNASSRERDRHFVEVREREIIEEK